MYAIYERKQNVPEFEEWMAYPKTMNEEIVPLKSCPFCNSKAEIIISYHTGGHRKEDYKPRCTNPSCIARLSKKYPSYLEATSAWNRRLKEI